MRRAGLAVWAAHQAAKALVRPGVTTFEIDAVIDEYFARQNAVPLFKGVPGKVPFPASTCISVNDEVVHGIPGKRRLKEGDIVSLDTGCRLNGWCGDSAYTHPVGRVSPEAQRLLDVTAQRFGFGDRTDGCKDPLERSGQGNGNLCARPRLFCCGELCGPWHRSRNA